MTTATETRTVTINADFDTRLAIASAGMDALLSQHDTAEAHAAAEEAFSTAGAWTPAPIGHPVLAAAADVIRQLGWCRESFVSEDGAVCAVGAIRTVCNLSPDGSGWTMDNYLSANDATTVLMGRIAETTGMSYSIPLWNDSRPDVNEVLRLMY